MPLGSHRRIAIFLAILSCALASSANGFPASQASSAIQLHPVTGTQVMLIPVYVNHEGPFLFLLDTGADRTILDAPLAKQLSLPHTPGTVSGTVGGTWKPSRTVLEVLQAGPVSVRNFAALEANLSAVRSALPWVKGILGQDFLARFNYLLSYKNRSILFERDHEIGDAIQGESVQLETPRTRMVVQARARIASEHTLRLLLDSGANTLVLNRESAAAARVVVTGIAFETTANAKLLMPSGRIDQLTIASHRLHDIPVALSSLPQIEGTCDGLLPTALFTAIYVNNREGFVQFVEDARQLPNDRRATGSTAPPALLTPVH